MKQAGHPVTELSLNKTSLALLSGTSETLVATVVPSDVTLKWSSSNNSVATVSNGTVTAVGNGPATITVKSEDGGKSATCSVTVTTAVTGVSLNKTSLSLEVGQSETLTATVSPSTASDKSVIWSSSNSSVASVTSSGKVTAVGNGTSAITVKSEDGSKSATCSVTVTTAVNGVSLNKTRLSLEVGKSETLTATVSPSTASNKSVTWYSSDSSVATVTSSGKVTAVKVGTTSITVTTVDGGKTAVCNVSIMEFSVDLGLSVKWASCNLGTNGFVSSPEEYGAYYAWGETSTKSDYNWTTYKWCNGSEYTLTKYNTQSLHGTVDNKKVLELSDDVARKKLGDSWRMPTQKEFQELIGNCTVTWTTRNGVKGRLFTSKKNGKSIFLPAAGYGFGGSSSLAGRGGYYWSSTLLTGEPICACFLDFDSNSVSADYGTDRYLGHSVRPVSK